MLPGVVNNFWKDNEKSMFLYLFLFHVIISVSLFIVANTEYLSSLHNGEGLWNFAVDSTLYHKEALNSIIYLENSEWLSWWQLYQDHQHVRIISLVYWLTGYYEPIIFEIVNGIVWTTSVLLIHRMARSLFPNNDLVPLFVVVFFFQPSVLISSTQLLRDPILILGFCFICYGFVLLSKKNSIWKWFFAIQFGLILLLSMREYLGILVLFFLLLPAIILVRSKKNIAPLILLLIPIILLEFSPQREVHISIAGIAAEVIAKEQVSQNQVSQNQVSQNQVSQNQVSQNQVSQNQVSQNQVSQNQVSQNQLSQNKSVYMAFLNSISERVSSMRSGFINVNSYAGSRIDADHKYNNFFDAVQYFPRALQIGFLSPFPSTWLEEGRQTGRVGKLLSGLEMIIWYLILLGFLYTILKEPSAIKPLAVVFLFSVIVIILLAYVVPNAGAIYRMRQAYMIPFFLFGSYGLHLIRNDFFKYTKSSKQL